MGQNWSMMTPCGMYMNANRTGGLAAFVPAAQLSESINGNARETPVPFRKVRRLTKVLFSMSLILGLVWGDQYSRFSSFDSAVCKQVTGDDLGDDCAHAIIVSGNFNH